MNGEKKPWIVHPWLAAIFPVLTLYVHNLYQVPGGHVFRPLLFNLSVVFVVMVLVRMFRLSRMRSAVLLSLFFLSFFMWGHVAEALLPPVLHLHHGLQMKLFLGYLLVIAAMGGAVLRIRPSILRNINSTANAFFVVLVVLVLVSGLAKVFAGEEETRRESSFELYPADRIPPDIDKPNMYLLMLDEYPRNDMLEKYFGYDNQHFIESLASMGFFYVDASRCNYSGTLWSLTSMFNVAFLDELFPGRDKSSKDLRPLLAAFSGNRVFSFLRALGYSIHTFDCGVDWIDLKEHSDVYYMKRGGITNFEELLLDNTPWPEIRVKIWPHSIYHRHRERINFIFDKMTNLAGSGECNQAALYYLHVVAPHPPIAFDADGGPVQLFSKCSGSIGIPPGMSRPDYNRFYIDQLRYINRRVEELVTAVIRCDPKAVIVVFSDHGLTMSEPDVERYDKVKNLLLVRLGDLPGDALRREETLINVFPHVFNALWGVDMPLRENRSYLPSWEKPFTWSPVPDPN